MTVTARASNGRIQIKRAGVAATPLRVPDLLATLALRLGVDPAARRYAGERPLSVVDGGRPIRPLLPS